MKATAIKSPTIVNEGHSFSGKNNTQKAERKGDKLKESSSSSHNFDMSRISILPRSFNRVQPKLKINAPNDKYEKEANHVADQIMRMPDSAIQSKSLVNEIGLASPIVQRRCSKCKEEENIQAKAAGQTTNEASNAVTNQIQNSKGGGVTMDTQTNSFMSSRFGTDFSGVKIHNDSSAAGMSKEINARAFTVGKDVYFNQGEYRPSSKEGQKLLAHELTHVIQQREGGHNIQRQVAAATPAYRDCNLRITGINDSNLRLENARQRAIRFVGGARRALSAAPAAGSVYATALARHFGAPTVAQRNTIRTNFANISGTFRVDNYICNSNNICNGEQAFHIASDDLVHVCRPFWGNSITCRAVILVHEGAHDVGIGIGGTHPPNRGSAQYPSGNNPIPAGQNTALRIGNPDAYAFFAAHIFRNADTNRTCF